MRSRQPKVKGRLRTAISRNDLRPQFLSQFLAVDLAHPMDTPDGTIPDVTYMPDAVDGMDSILI